MLEGIGEALEGPFKIIEWLAKALVICMPLGLWKLIEIIAWVFDLFSN